MKILLVHNHYGSAAPSGENRVFELERDLLQRNGHDVRTLERHSDTLIAQGWVGKAQGALSTPWNFSSAARMREIMRTFRPDVVHAHNTFPLLSPAIFSAARGAARVLTLHNYRLVCPAAIPMRKGRVCTECIARQSVLPSIRHGCYRGSRIATLPLAANVALHRYRRTWERNVDAFIALSDFQKDLMCKGGLPAKRIIVKPNCLPEGAARPLYSNRPTRIVFVGRISEEKGVQDLVEAWLKWGEQAPELRILGDGPLKSELEKKAGSSQKISFLGKVDKSTVEAEVASARLLVLPSRWYEIFGLALLDGLRHGTPIAVSNLGPLPDIASDVDGIVFEAGQPENLMHRVAERWKDTARMKRMSDASVRVFEAKYTEAASYRNLMRIYEDALSQH